MERAVARGDDHPPPQFRLQLAPIPRSSRSRSPLSRTPSVFRGLDGWIRRRLRCYQWKQWKTPRHRARELLKMGIGRYLAWGIAYNGAGLWHIAGCPAMTKSLTHAKLTAMGFHSLHERYLALATA